MAKRVSMTHPKINTDPISVPAELQGHYEERGWQVAAKAAAPEPKPTK